MSDRIETRHPDPNKAGTNIDLTKYETVRDAIVESLTKNDVLTFSALTNDVKDKLAGNFDGSISWYVTTVKLDLEARGVLERVDNRSPQRIRLTR